MDAATQNLLALIGIYALMAASLALVNGVAGQFSLGHAAFQAVGAYGSAILFALLFSNVHGQFRDPDPTEGWSPWGFWACAWGTILLGGIVAAAVGWLVALPCLRLRGDYLAIATLGFNEIVGVLIRAQGPIGRVDPGGPRGFNDLPRRAAGGLWEIGLTLLIVLFLLGRLVRSRRGRAFAAVRDDEVAAEAVGVDTTRTKLEVFVLSAFISGVAGGLYAFHYGSLTDRAFDFQHSIDYVLMVILGGGSPLGSAAAAAGLTFLNDRFRGLEHGRMVAYGFLLVWIMVARLNGLTRWAWMKGLAQRARESGPGGTVDRPWRIEPSKPPAGPLLSVQNATIRFGGLVAVEGLSLEVGPDECVGLIGPNGAGKSTVFNLMTGVYRPTSGTISIAGHRVDGLRPSRVVARGVVRTFQNVRLFGGMTVLDNVRTATLGRHPEGLGAAFLRRAPDPEIGAACQALLTRFGLADVAGVLAGGLPYGVQRRLEIARALATGPDLLLLDEPAAGMNPREKEGLKAILRSIHEEGRVALLVIEHDMGFVMDLCGRIIVLDHGKMIAAGSPEEVRADPGVIEAYLGSEDVATGAADRVS